MSVCETIIGILRGSYLVLDTSFPFPTITWLPKIGSFKCRMLASSKGKGRRGGNTKKIVRISSYLPFFLIVRQQHFFQAPPHISSKLSTLGQYTCQFARRQSQHWIPWSTPLAPLYRLLHARLLDPKLVVTKSLVFASDTKAIWWYATPLSARGRQPQGGGLLGYAQCPELSQDDWSWR